MDQNLLGEIYSAACFKQLPTETKPDQIHEEIVTSDYAD